MKNLGRIMVMIPGVVASLLIGSEVIYVALLADARELSEYPWGSGFGWAYQSKYHYLASGVLWTLVAWVPYISWRVRQNVMKREIVRKKSA
ncbi:MAG: hypothetical protein OEX03_00465 [Gammaproteobacteria bacterium]|nr:hypothetical protein [Gammaproteobacteria bacterium]